MLVLFGLEPLFMRQVPAPESLQSSEVTENVQSTSVTDNVQVSPVEGTLHSTLIIENSQSTPIDEVSSSTPGVSHHTPNKEREASASSSSYNSTSYSSSSTEMLFQSLSSVCKSKGPPETVITTKSRRVIPPKRLEL